jgi:hypothetical protein
LQPAFEHHKPNMDPTNSNDWSFEYVNKTSEMVIIFYKFISQQRDNHQNRFIL